MHNNNRSSAERQQRRPSRGERARENLTNRIWLISKCKTYSAADNITLIRRRKSAWRVSLWWWVAAWGCRIWWAERVRAFSWQTDKYTHELPKNFIYIFCPILLNARVFIGVCVCNSKHCGIDRLHKLFQVWGESVGHPTPSLCNVLSWSRSNVWWRRL